MTLLETIRALDAPYVVWLHPTDFFDTAADVFETTRGVFVSTVEGYCVQLRIKPTAVTPAFEMEDVDAMLSSLDDGLARVGT